MNDRIKLYEDDADMARRQTNLMLQVQHEGFKDLPRHEQATIRTQLHLVNAYRDCLEWRLHGTENFASLRSHEDE